MAQRLVGLHHVAWDAQQTVEAPCLLGEGSLEIDVAGEFHNHARRSGRCFERLAFGLALREPHPQTRHVVHAVLDLIEEPLDPAIKLRHLGSQAAVQLRSLRGAYLDLASDLDRKGRCEFRREESSMNLGQYSSLDPLTPDGASVGAD
jgi:hypothetical protein